MWQKVSKFPHCALLTFFDAVWQGSTLKGGVDMTICKNFLCNLKIFLRKAKKSDFGLIIFAPPYPSPHSK